MLSLEYLIYHVKSFGGDSDVWFNSEVKPTPLKNDDSALSSRSSKMQGMNIVKHILKVS